MTRLLLPLLILVSCSSSSKTNWKTLKNEANYREKLIPVSSREEARKVINNKVNFIKMIFEQSKDPYFGTPRWSDQCMSINKIGTVTDSPNGIQAISFLILDHSGEPGFCNDRSNQARHSLIYLYCDGMKNVLEIKYPSLKEFEPASDDLCE
jgi:hypothetical protein